MMMKEKFGFFGPATLLYAVVYVFCTFKNPSGITFPIFIAASLIYMGLALSKLGVVLKKSSLFYLISMMLLGVSTFCTDDRRIIVMNKTGIFILMLTVLLQQFYDTSDWQLGRQLKSMLRLLFVSLGEIGRPFSDGRTYLKENNKILNKKVAAVLIGVVAALPILMVVLMLLGSADAVFGDMLDSVRQGIRLGENIIDLIDILFRICVFTVIVYAWLAYLSGDKLPKEETEGKKGEPIIGITVTGILTSVYLLFCGIQVVYLFFGKMTLPEGYTYAGYAREGFFQLLAVSVLNLIIVLVSMGCFRESKVLKVILTIMSLCTFILIISSALRMIMYIRYYFLTFLRVFVLWALVVLFLLFIGVVMNIWREKMPLFRYSLAVMTVLYLMLSFSHPDYYIAKVNVANTIHSAREEWAPQKGDFFQSGSPYNDYDYLRDMSADAAPVLIAFLAEEEASAEGYHYYQRYLDEMQNKVRGEGWRQFNISRYIMKKYIKRVIIF